MIVNVWGVSVSTVSFFAVGFCGCMVGVLELSIATSYLLVVFGSCGGVVHDNLSIIVSVALATSSKSLFAVGLFDVPWQY